MASRSAWLKTGSRPFLRRLSSSAETPTTRRSPRAAARSITRRCPTWNTSNVPKVMTVRGMPGSLSRPVVGKDGGDMATTLTMITPDSDADERRRRGLRRMRTVAVSLLGLAAVVYVATLGEDGFWGFVNAGAEASMVGAIADWFAVTAIFKHPLGLPIPHTALIPRRKEMLGRSLEEFVGENFLAEPVIRERIEAAALSRRFGEWLAVEANARRAVDEAAALLHIGLSRVRDADLVALVEEALLPRFIEEPISPVAGSLLQEVVRDGAHHGLVDLALAEARDWLVQNEETFTDIVAERAPWWSPSAVNDRVTRRIHLELVAWIEDISRDPYHHARTALDSALAQLADDLLHDPPTQERAERLKNRVLSHPQLVTTATSLWNAFRRALLESLEDPDGPLRRRALAELSGFAA